MIVPVIAISNLVLTQQIYSEETNGAHAHYREPVPLMFIPRIGEMTEIGHLFALLLSKIRVPIPRMYFRFFNFLFLSCTTSFNTSKRLWYSFDLRDVGFAVWVATFILDPTHIHMFLFRLLWLLVNQSGLLKWRVLGPFLIMDSTL